MIKVVNTRNMRFNGEKVFIYGLPKIGKTTLCTTAPSPVLLSTDRGLKTLKDNKIYIDAIEIDTFKKLEEAYKWCIGSNEARKYKTFCLDSISETTEKVFTKHAIKKKSYLSAYDKTYVEITDISRKFRDIPNKHICFISEQRTVVDDKLKITTYMPAMVTRKITDKISYLFNQVLVYRLSDDGKSRYIQTKKDYQYPVLGDRSGKLAPQEPANLTYIFKKSAGEIV
jgi:hypothetical protein